MDTLMKMRWRKLMYEYINEYMCMLKMYTKINTLFHNLSVLTEHLYTNAKIQAQELRYNKANTVAIVDNIHYNTELMHKIVLPGLDILDQIIDGYLSTGTFTYTNVQPFIKILMGTIDKTIDQTRSNVSYFGGLVSVGLLMTGLVIPALTTAILTGGYYMSNGGQQDYNKILGKLQESLRVFTLDTNKNCSMNKRELEYFKCQINYIRGKLESLQHIKDI